MEGSRIGNATRSQYCVVFAPRFSAAFREDNQVWGRVMADIPDFNRELIKALNDE
jgi:hypothetical protein